VERVRVRGEKQELLAISIGFGKDIFVTLQFPQNALSFNETPIFPGISQNGT
jgi:hypothetical protein